MAKKKTEPLFWPVYLQGTVVGHVYLRPGVITPHYNLCPMYETYDPDKEVQLVGFEVGTTNIIQWPVYRDGPKPKKTRTKRIKSEIVKPAIRKIDLED